MRLHGDVGLLGDGGEDLIRQFLPVFALFLLGFLFLVQLGPSRHLLNLMLHLLAFVECNSFGPDFGVLSNEKLELPPLVWSHCQEELQIRDIGVRHQITEPCLFLNGFI